jgi:hypothetical protein
MYVALADQQNVTEYKGPQKMAVCLWHKTDKGKHEN